MYCTQFQVVKCYLYADLKDLAVFISACCLSFLSFSSILFISSATHAHAVNQNSKQNQTFWNIFYRWLIGAVICNADAVFSVTFKSLTIFCIGKSRYFMKSISSWFNFHIFLFFNGCCANIFSLWRHDIEPYSKTFLKSLNESAQWTVENNLLALITPHPRYRWVSNEWNHNIKCVSKTC